jgi:glycosyltransferase involved in cell wall biosynthesis
MKIVSITPDIDSGGAAKSLFVLARALARQDRKLHVISIAQASRTKRKVEELRAMGVEVSFFNIPYFPLQLIVCPIPFWANAKRTLARLGEFRRLRGLVRDLSPDVLHYNSYTTLHIAALLGGIPSVLHAREVLVEPAWMLPLLKKIMRSRIAEVIAISPEEGEQAERLFGLPVTTIFNSPLAPPTFAPLPDSTPLVYGVFSHITPIKGQLELVRACAKAARGLREAGVEIRVFGGTVGIHQNYYESVVREIEANGIGDIITLAGFTDDPEGEMRKCHLIVRPDATGQPWGRDIIESMSMGRPILAAGSSQTFVKPGETGLLVPPKDTEALAAALLTLADRDVLEAMSNKAFEFAKMNFNPDRNLQATIDRLTAVAAAHRLPGR